MVVRKSGQVTRVMPKRPHSRPITFVIWSHDRKASMFAMSGYIGTPGSSQADRRKRIIRGGKEGGTMSSKLGNWLIAMGAVFVTVALLCIAAASAKADRSSVLALAGSLFSTGAMMISGGLYVKARFFTTQNSSTQNTDATRRVRGGCDLCAGDTPVIHCKVHQLHLCPACLAQHYDFRSCAYVPSTRKPSSRVRTMAKGRGA